MDRLIQAFDNSDIDYKTSGKNVQPGEINICCPSCREEGFHGAINIQKSVYHCRACRNRQTLKNLLQTVLRATYPEIILLLRHLKRENLYEDTPEALKTTLQHSQALNFPDFTYDLIPKREKDPEWPLAMGYLTIKRRFFKPAIMKYGVKYNVRDDRMGGRVIVPIYLEGKLVNYYGRDYTGDQLKHLYAPEVEVPIPKKEILYGIDEIKSKKIVVVEGIFDCWRVQEAGLNCVAIFTKSFSQHQLPIFSRLNLDSVTIMFDGDGGVEAQMLADELTFIVGSVKIADLPEESDPASLTAKEISYYYQSAQRV